VLEACTYTEFSSRTCQDSQ